MNTTSTSVRTFRSTRFAHSALVALLGAALGVFLLSGTCKATILLAEDFPANERTVSNLPETAAWYYSSADSALINNSVSGSLVLNTQSNSRILLGQFTTTPVTLGIGQTLTANFTFSGVVGSNTGNNNFRFGLFNTGTGTAITADGFNNDNDFGGYTGYLATVSTTSTAHGAKFYYKKSTNTRLLSGIGSTPDVGSPQVGSTGPATAFTSNEVYSATYSITRVDSETVNIFLSFAGDGFDNYQVSRNDTVALYTTFDTFAIGTAAGNIFNTLTLHTIDISVIPEPATGTLLLGAGGLLALLAKRRRNP